MSTYTGKGLGRGGPRVAKPKQTSPSSPSEDLQDLEDLEDLQDLEDLEDLQDLEDLEDLEDKYPGMSADDIVRKQNDEFTEYLRELFKKNATLEDDENSKN